MPKANIKFETKPEKQKAFMVGVDLQHPKYKHLNGRLPLAASLEELALLCDTAGIEVVGQMTQKLDVPNSNTFIGPGKVEELIAWKTAVNFDVIVFDDELSPRHQRELEEAVGLGITVLDRTGLILDIFAQHASTREGALQVELAQYEYRKPRLTRAWTHLARQGGGASGRSGNGGVGLRGPGETQLEIDKRLIDNRISRLKTELEKVREQRSQHRAQRKKGEAPVVAIVGYTNAGKSTFINTLAKADVKAADQLFATLDPTTRRVRMPHEHNVLFTDTVGFIQKLPTQLVASFRATLEEVTEADALLHVVDVTHPNALEQAETVIKVLSDLGAGKKPMIIALNKADKLLPPDVKWTDDDGLFKMMADNANVKGILSEGIPISGLKRLGFDRLLAEVEAVLFERLLPIKVRLPYKAGDLMSLLRREGTVEMELPEEKGVVLVGRVPGRLMDAFAPYAV